MKKFRNDPEARYTLSKFMREFYEKNLEMMENDDLETTEGLHLDITHKDGSSVFTLVWRHLSTGGVNGGPLQWYVPLTYNQLGDILEVTCALQQFLRSDVDFYEVITWNTDCLAFTFSITRDRKAYDLISRINEYYAQNN